MSAPLPSDSALGLNIRPTLPRRKDWRIGCVGAGFIIGKNWTGIPPEMRKLPQQQGIDDAASDVAKGEDARARASGVSSPAPSR